MSELMPLHVWGRTESLPAVPALFLLGAIACFTPWVGPPLALALGAGLSLTVGNPYPTLSDRLVKPLLQGSVVLLGFGMDLPAVLRTGASGMVFAAFTIGLTLAFAAALGRLLRVERAASQLIGSGTAICGGSAIAAVSGVIGATGGPITVAMGTVFVLNAAALYLFPPLGHLLGLTQEQFGTWAGVAIHDVSSVVGAAHVYGPRALEVATAVKLSRALWIVPVCLVASWTERRHRDARGAPRARASGKAAVPWFIGLFLLASVARTSTPGMETIAPLLVGFAKSGLTFTLFLIGSGLSLAVLRQTGWRPLLQGVLLWIFISGFSLTVILITM